MRTGRNLKLAFAYLRLSNEEARSGESSSIANQRQMISDYCHRNSISLIREFVDDGYSGGNFDRPAFQDMLRQLSQGKANMVITKDLSRLGRDMRESSYYAVLPRTWRPIPDHCRQFRYRARKRDGAVPICNERGLSAGWFTQSERCPAQQARKRAILRLSPLRLP